MTDKQKLKQSERNNVDLRTEILELREELKQLHIEIQTLKAQQVDILEGLERLLSLTTKKGRI